jgi:hypothetical protein
MKAYHVKLGLIVVACLVVLGGALLWALPEIVRRVAEVQIPKRTGRAVSIEDVDLNLFTGHLAVKKVRLADRQGADAFLEFERLDLRVWLPALVRSHVRLTEITLAAPSVRVVRTGPAEFNFSDLLTPAPEPERPPAPSRWVFTVERLHITRGIVRADDRVVAPPAEWVIHDLEVQVADLTTRADAPPGRLAVHAKINEAALDVRADPLRLEPLRIGGKLALEGFELRRLNPYVYVPLGTPYRPKGGRLALSLVTDVDSDAGEVRKAVLSGTASVDGEALAAVGRDEPFLSAARLSVAIKEADALHRSLTVSSVAIDGLDLKARRDAGGVIDLLALFAPRRAGAPTASGATAAVAPTPPTPSRAPPPSARPRTLFPVIQALARGFEQIHVEQITLAPGRLAFIDEAVKPTTTLALTKFQARVDDFTWPATRPAMLALSSSLPGGGTLTVNGPVTAWPLDADLKFALRDAPVEPYQAYIPIAARLSGRFNGDSRNRIVLQNGQLVAASKGTSWAQHVEIRAPDAERPAIRVERMELVGIDFEWPTRAIAARAGFRRPLVEIERGAGGDINLRALFTPTEPEGGPAPATSEAAARPVPEGPPRKGLLESMQIEIGAIRIEDGFVRFLDRTTQPAFSQDISRLQLTVTGLTNRPGQRAELAMQSAVGGDADLDIKGQISSLGSPPFIDLVGELRSFKLTSVDPYAANAVGWVVKKGELQYRLHFKLDGDQLTAENDMVMGQLQVAPARATDEVKQRIGLPLGLIVALIKDQKGDIRVNVPVAGTVNDPAFDLKETIWTAIKNVLVNIVTAPFKAIRSLFAKGDKLEEPKVDPVTFTAGNAELSPPMEEHLLRVADFLRRTPFANLAMRPAPSAADVEALKAEAVSTRLREFQRERGLDSLDAAIAAYYKEYLPGKVLADSVEAQLALLREHEPMPAALVADLGRRRLDVTRERLLKTEGIPADRLTIAEAAPAPEPPAADPSEPGRIEFAIVPSAE